MEGRPGARDEEVVRVLAEDISKKAETQVGKVRHGQFVQVFEKAHSEQKWLGLDGAVLLDNKEKANPET